MTETAGRTSVLLLCATVVAASVAAQPAGTAFTYQGRLANGGVPASGPFDLRFVLFDAPAGGTQVGPVVVLEDVQVVDGLFTVNVDFGAAFVGSARFMEVGVRPGPSTGAFTVLGTRQEVKPAPQATFSAGAPWAGVTGKPPGFADGVDDDALGALTCSPGQVAKWGGSAWACAPDANSGGTVSSIATGAGLTGGPITGSGTVAVAGSGITTPLLADAAVTSAKIANGAVGLTQINSAQVQARIGGTCPPGQYLRGINADGAVVCEPFHAPTTVSVVDDDASGNTGLYSSIAIAPDGKPVVGYGRADQGSLMMAKCGNVACTTRNLAVVDDPSPNYVATYTALVIGADGLPVMAYNDSTAGALKVAKCGNAACTSGNAITTVDDPANDVGWLTSIAIGTDGLPVISYQDFTAGSMKVAKCGNDLCNSGNVITTVDNPSGPGGGHTAIAIGADGLPIISYYNTDPPTTLKVAHCVNASCFSVLFPNTITDVAPVLTCPVAAGCLGTSIAIGADGLPVISYQSASKLMVAKCGTAGCE